MDQSDTVGELEGMAGERDDSGRCDIMVGLKTSPQ